jgi:hypothetical protein
VKNTRAAVGVLPPSPQYLLQVLLDMAFCHLKFGKDPEASLRCAD